MGIGTNLKILRGKTKFSQQDIANMLDLDRTTYINWENETSDIKSQYLPKLAEIFKVNIDDLFDNDKKFNIINNSESKDNSIGIVVFNFSDKALSEELSSQIGELIKNLKK
jgi:transcriptional regulator with XRE-family HTH domain